MFSGYIMCVANENVAILLATYNGGAFLNQQLDSFKTQSHSSWSLYVSDDGSTDDTLKIIQEFSLSNRNVKIHHGPGKGFAQNFMSLIVDPSISANYYAFSDQDDIWCQNKLSSAVAFLKKVPAHMPAVYCSRSILIDGDNKKIGCSPLYKKPAFFQNSLLQNIASGNTMIFNHKARILLAKLQNEPMIAHDWSLYQVVTACGGVVYYDQEPMVLYRQHSNNIIGNGMSPLRRLKNFCSAMNGRTANWNDININLLNCLDIELTDEAKKNIAAIKLMRNSSFFSRLHLYFNNKFYHQTVIGNLTNFFYVILNKF